MLFNSFAFLLFLPLFMIGYWLTRGRARLWVMFLASLLFYGWWDWRFLFLLLFSAIVDYSLGLLLENERDEGARHRLIVLSVVVNLGLLGFFKYFNFFADSAMRVSESLGMPVSWNVLRIVLPVGISFYVFKTMSYTIDVYRRTQPAERDLLRFATFVVFFPELVAGPIVRASRLLPQLMRDSRFDYQRALSGLSLICSGYVRKVVVADSLAPLVDVRFAHPEAHSALSLLIGVYFYAFQIYCDFSGYSNIAIGIARILGFDFGINFDRPYFSRSFSEFWARWHISLSSWLRDYLYIPLGGNRGGSLFTVRNLMITMLLGGLWHGAQWTFVAWGGLHGLYLVLQRILGPLYRRLVTSLRIPRFVSDAFLVLLVFHLTCFAWVFFRAQSFGNAWRIISTIAARADLSLAAVDNKLLVIKGAMLIAVLLLAELVTLSARDVSPMRRLAFAATCVWVLLLFGSFSGNTFIYFQF
jgi:alginate O-acetyltransferase complex protein AlgI